MAIEKLYYSEVDDLKYEIFCLEESQKQVYQECKEVNLKLWKARNKLSRVESPDRVESPALEPVTHGMNMKSFGKTYSWEI